MHLSFLTPRVERLSAEGRFEPLHPGGAIGRFRRPVVLLDRSLCTFARLETAALPRGRRRQAARLHARLASPYVTGGAALVKAGADFGIWWWDLDRVELEVAERFGPGGASLRPETLAQPAGEGFRIVRLAVGYEAQLWRSGALIASSWRLDRFDPQHWLAFCSLQRGADAAASPPAAVSLPISFESEAFSFSTSEISREQAIAGAAGGFACVAMAIAAFLFGQGIQLGDRAEALTLEAVALRAETPAAASVQALDATRRRLADFRAIEERTNPLSAAGAAIGIVAFYDLSPTAVDAEEDTLRITLPYSAVERADELVADFEQSGYFYDIEPRTEPASQSLIIEMSVRSAAPPLSAVG